MKAVLIGASLAAMLAACSTQQAALRIKAVGEETVRPDDGSLAKAQVLLSRGDYALAIDAYRKAVRYDPANAAAYNGLAISYDELGRFDLSRRYYELALARAPREAKYYRNLALSLKRQGKADEATAVLVQMEAAQGVQAAVVPAVPSRSLADIARDGLVSVADAASDALGPHLERLSLGEVRLATRAPDAPVMAARSITVPIPAVEAPVRFAKKVRPAEDIPSVRELAARPIGISITIEIPPADPIAPVETPPAQMAAAADITLAELAAEQPATEPVREERGIALAMAAEPAALLAMALRPMPEPEAACNAPAQNAAYEAAMTANAGLLVFMGDFAPKRFGKGGAIDLPLFYPASANLPMPARAESIAPHCAVRMADTPPAADALFTLLWRDMGGAA